MLKKIVALLTTACIAVTMAAPAFAATRTRSGLTAESSGGTLKIKAPQSVELTADKTTEEITVEVTLGDSDEVITDATISASSADPQKVGTAVNNQKVTLTRVGSPTSDAVLEITLGASKDGYTSASATFEVTVKASTTPNPDPSGDQALIDAAKTAIEEHTFTAEQAEASTEDAARNKAESIIGALPAVSGKGLTVTVATDGNGFTAPVAGTIGDSNGTDGSYQFKATVAKGTATTKTTNTLTMNITATSYTPAGSVRVSFNTNGGTAISDQVISAHTVATKPADPTKNGFTFGGWYRDEACTQAFDFMTPVAADITLYAKWTKNTPDPNPDPNPDPDPDPTPDTYTITVSSAVGGRGSASPAQAKKGESVSVTAVSASGYEFDFWSANPVVDFADRFAARTSFAMMDEDVTVIPHFKKADDSSSSSSSSSSSEEASSPSSSSKDKDGKSDNVFGDGSGAYGYTGGGSRNTAAKKDTASKAGTVTTAAAEKTAEEAISKAIEKAVSNDDGTANAAVSFRNVQTMSPETFKAINAKAAENSDEVDVNVTVHLDTIVNGMIAARLYIDPKAAAKLDAPISTSVDTSEKSATNSAVAKLFGKYFENDAKVVTFGQKGEFGMPVPVAIKVDLTKFDVQNLMFYNYDIATNSFSLIEAPAFFVDNAGFVHFITKKGGSLIITDSALKTK